MPRIPDIQFGPSAGAVSDAAKAAATELLKTAIKHHSAGDLSAAEAGYEKIVDAKLALAPAYANLAIICQQSGRVDRAISLWQAATKINPDFAEAWNNLASALLNQAKYAQSETYSEKALAINPDYVSSLYNLATAQHQQGKLDQAFNSYGEVLKRQPDFAQAIYKQGAILSEQGKLEQAMDYFSRSKFYDWELRVLQGHYKAEHYPEFQQALKELLPRGHYSPLVAALSAHYAHNFCCLDPYNFCPKPLDFVYQSNISVLAGESSRLRKDLLADIKAAQGDARRQSLVHQGMQSTGNLFQRSESSFAALLPLIEVAIGRYRQRFSAAECQLIRHFPERFVLGNAWFVALREGGLINSHMHESGWISGSLYLALPESKDGDLAGAIELSMDSDSYPSPPSSVASRRDFPAMTLPLSVGDIVLFPSSVFHRTLPFSGTGERVCVAFDLKPS